MRIESLWRNKRTPMSEVITSIQNSTARRRSKASNGRDILKR